MAYRPPDRLCNCIPHRISIMTDNLHYVQIIIRWSIQSTRQTTCPGCHTRAEHGPIPAVRHRVYHQASNSGGRNLPDPSFPHREPMKTGCFIMNPSLSVGESLWWLAIDFANIVGSLQCKCSEGNSAHLAFGGRFMSGYLLAAFGTVLRMLVEACGKACCPSTLSDSAAHSQLVV